MAIHVVIGATRGIGYALLQHFSKDPNNTVVGVARDVESTMSKIRKDNLSSPNVHIVYGELTDPGSLNKAAAETAKATGGIVDYLWSSAGYMHPDYAQTFLTEYNTPELFQDMRFGFETNVIGTVNVFNAFLPLVRRSEIKKIISLSTGLADTKITSGYGIWEGAAYSVDKAALNMVVAKYDAKFRSEGILFLAISPGVVDTGYPPQESDMPKKFYKYSKGLRVLQPPESVEYVWKVVDECTVEEDGGQFYSHLGRHQRWL